jgi:glycosyltransferase involved in cell wall biosynthesis
MRIGIDARELSGRATGAGRYLAGLLTAWSSDERARRHEFVLYSAEPLAVPLDSRRFQTRLVQGAGTWWEQIRLPKVAASDHLDVFFSPAYTAPLVQKAPTVVAIHDLSFAAHPEWFTAREGLRRRWLTRQAARRARAIVTISEFSRGELIERFDVPPSRIHVIPPGVTAPRVGATPERQAKVLFVGSIFNRRHVPDLVRAFTPIARAHPEATLDIVGDNRSYPYQNLLSVVTLENLDGRVRWRQYVGDDDLWTLYGSARAFAFLSEYEGLGLTPLEALAAGVPAVLLDTPVARESCGEAAIYVKIGDMAGTTGALEQLLFDEAVRRSLMAAAPATLARYSWPRAARETLAVLVGSG